MPEKYYLKQGDRVFTTGAYLIWDGKKWILGGLEDDTYYDGELVENDDDKPYIVREVNHA